MRAPITSTRRAFAGSAATRALALVATFAPVLRDRALVSSVSGSYSSWPRVKTFTIQSSDHAGRTLVFFALIFSLSSTSALARVQCTFRGADARRMVESAETVFVGEIVAIESVGVGRQHGEPPM